MKNTEFEKMCQKAGVKKESLCNTVFTKQFKEENNRYQMRYTVRVDNEFKTGIEGTYKTELIAERHLRKLRRKYPGTEFKIIPV